MPRLLRDLKSHDPEVAIRAAWYLTARPEHTEAVVHSVLRVFPKLKLYRSYHIFHRLGERLKPYLPKVLKRYEASPSDVWFGLLQAVELTEPLLADAVWKAFQETPDEATASRAARFPELFVARLLRQLRADEPASRQAAALVFEHVQARVVRDHYEGIHEALQALDPSDPARLRVEAAIQKLDVTGPAGPHHPWLDLR